MGKVLILLLFSTAAYGQVSLGFVERTILRETISNDTLSLKASVTADRILTQLALTGDYTFYDDGWYGSVMTYAGDRIAVESAIIEDRANYKTGSSVFIYSDYNPESDISLVMIYTFY